MSVQPGSAADVKGSAGCDYPGACGRENSVPKLVIGRVGALAAVLGIGAAVFAAPGLAAADTGGSGGASGSASSSGSTSSGSRGPVHRSSRTAVRSSTPEPAGVSGAGSVEAVAGRWQTGRQARRSGPVTENLPNSTESEAVVSRGARTGAHAAAGVGDFPAAKDGGSESPRVAPAAVVTVPRAAAAAVSATTDPELPAAARAQGTSGNAGASAVAITAAPVRQAGTAATASSASATQFVGSVFSAPAAQLVQKVDDQTQAVVRTIFHKLLNWTSTLPINPLTSWLEGGLLMVRKSLFNQTAGVHSVQTANSPTLVTGKIDVIDLEGDGWKVELVSEPSHGTVVLGKTSQTNGIGSTKYTYTPGEGYTGDDEFVVEVTPTDSVFNILHPFGVLDSRYYTVAVGDTAEAAKGRFNLEGADPKDTADTHLFLSNAAANFTVKKQGLFDPKLAVTMTLPAETAAKSFAWMDTRGNMGSIPVDTMLVDDWGDYSDKAAENGVKPLLTFKYSDEGVEKAVFVEVGSVTKNADGSYTISGDLKEGAPAQDGRVDTWDFAGRKYKAAFDNFLDSAGLEDCKSGQACATVSAVGTLGTTTLSPSAFTETGGHDYPQAKTTPQEASALQTNPGSMGPGTTDVGTGNGTQIVGETGLRDLELTAMIPWGTDGSFIAATNLSQATPTNNGIFLFTAGAPRGGEPTWTKTPLLQPAPNGMPPVWNAAVNVMAQYDQVLTDSTGTPIPTTYTGTLSGATSLKLAVTSDVDPSSLIGQTIAGNGITPGTQINGWISSDLSGITYSVDNPIAPTASPIAVTLPDTPTTQPGLVIGLSDGSVYYWNSTGCMSATCVGPVVNGAGVTVVQGVDSPVSLAMSPDGQVYALGDNLTVIDSATNTITAILGLARPGPVPQVVVSPDGFYAYATTYLGNDTAGLAVIDTAQNTVSTYLALPQYTNADAVAISPDSTFGYIASGSTGSVYRFTTSSNPVTNPPVLGTVIALPGAQPDPGYAGVAFSPDGSTLYVSYAQNGNVYVIDTATDTVTQTIGLAGRPSALAVSPDGMSLIVTNTPNFNANYVSVIDTSTNQLSNVITVGNGPSGVAFNPNPGLPYAYVTNSNDSTVSVIDTQTWTVVGTFASGAGGDDTLGIAVSPDGLNIYLGNYDGGGDDYGTVPVFQVATPVEQGWAQLQASNGWGPGVAVNAITSLLNNKGFVVGLSDGAVATWDNPILADGTIVPTAGLTTCSNGSPNGCWTVVSQPGSPMNSVNAIMASGQDAGFVVMGTAPGGDGWIGGFNGAAANFGPDGAYFDASNPTTLLPFDGTTLLAAIGDRPVIAEDGPAGINSVISAPSYVSMLPDLSASTAGCTWSYNSGSGAGCGGYVLTVQEAGGNPIRVGQILYGGPGLTSGTTITAQISDGAGNLCAPAGPGCNGGGTGVYLVDTEQLVAPGTPMSASDGTGFIVGFSNGAVAGFNNGLPQIADTTWNAAHTTIMPWRDGFVVGLNNGAVMYWSPSNTAGSSLFVPDAGTPAMALDYPDASFTVASQPIQGAGWTQLQGWNYTCGCLGWDQQAVTSMVPMGDGFAVGLTSPTLGSNGQVQLFSGFGALSTSSAFGYLQSTTDPTNTVNNSGNPVTATTLQALIAANAFTQIAANNTITDLPPGTVGSVQQMVPINQLIKDANGNRWNASSLVMGLTDNGIYSWGGSNYPPAPSDTAWKQQQAPAALPGQLDSGTLASAWGYAADQTQAFGSSTANTSAVGGPNDPIFQQSQLYNQAWCGTASQCASDGDFTPFAFDYSFGNDGVIYTLADEGPFAAQLNLTAKGYGYVFVPGGIWDKFVPDDYSAGLLIAVQGGPSVVFNPPAALTGPIKGTLKDSGSYTATQDTEVGVFGETVGLDASLTAQINLKKTPDGVLTLAEALYTPGLLFTWNTYGNPDSLGMSYSSFDTTSIVSLSDLESYFDINGDATVTATITPYASVSYGLFTDVLDIFKLSVGYQNPITAHAKIPLSDPSNFSFDITSQGFLTASAAFIPGITSDLSWKGKYQVYSV